MRIERAVLRPLNDQGKEVDASFRLVVDHDGLGLYFASRGGTLGTPSARNTEYHIGLPLLLSRLKSIDAVVRDVFLDSKNARSLPDSDRRLTLPSPISMPLRLADVDDVERLRRIISDAQKNVATASGRNPKHGNRMRSIRFLLDLGPGLTEEGIALLERVLVEGHEDPNMATADPPTLRRRAARLAANTQPGTRKPPAGSTRPATVRVSGTVRFLRSPAVVAYVVSRAAGLCELCGRSPFKNDYGGPFLEVHHVCQLAAGGPDTVDNAAALCPNCHRELHYGAERVAKSELLYERVPELSRYRSTSLSEGDESR